MYVRRHRVCYTIMFITLCYHAILSIFKKSFSSQESQASFSDIQLNQLINLFSHWNAITFKIVIYRKTTSGEESRCIWYLCGKFFE